jgi:tetratricopeptide (TPR) repeat protein
MKRQIQKKVNSAEHRTSFEERLSHFLHFHCAKSEITIDDIKDIIWNAIESNLVSRLAFMVFNENPKIDMNDILQIFNEAWNHFPHKELNGLSPREMVERKNEDVGFIADERRTFYEVFSDRFAPNMGIKKISKNTWTWEFPAKYHSASSLIMSTQKEIIENDDFSDTSIAQLDRKFSTELSSIAIKDLLDENPLQFDAVVFLTKDLYSKGNAQDALHMLRTTIDSAEKLFPSSFELGKDLLPWGFLDNRPYLNLLGEYATLLDMVDGPSKAIPFYEKIVSLNPNDNQGIRGYLATAYLKTDRLDELLLLDKKYPRDLLPNLKVATILALYKLNRVDEAKKLIKKIKKYFKHVFTEILKTDHIEPLDLLPDRVTVGGDDEAWVYWQDQGTLWMATKGARDFLRDELSK